MTAKDVRGYVMWQDETGTAEERTKEPSIIIEAWTYMQARRQLIERESERMSLVVGVVGGVGADGAGVKLNAWHMVA